MAHRSRRSDVVGYLLALGDCFACGRPFTFNPYRVPSHPDSAGIRQPICANCVRLANVQRERNGLEPIVPLPGAYEPEPDDDSDAWPSWLRKTPDGYEIVDRD